MEGREKGEERVSPPNLKTKLRPCVRALVTLTEFAQKVESRKDFSC